ncbi:MAG: hypothetical protein LBD31_03350 [Treponema sp.]|jgi:hypothetical protein|nr:hypothetical protein [Treponema sp.]
MEKKKNHSLRDLLSDRFSGTWRLLSETSLFLSRTPVFSHYENQLRIWRRDLQSAGNRGDIARHVRNEITELRRSLRLQGYDLSLARQNLIIDGFRNDTALGDGFRRVVIFFAEDDIYWLAGEDNHITLADFLERQIESAWRRRSLTIRSKHYLWYRRRGDDLILSGSDTETKEDFKRLKAMGEANSLVILARLRGLQ